MNFDSSYITMASSRNMTVNWTYLKSGIEPLGLQIFQLKQYNGLVKTEEDN